MRRFEEALASLWRRGPISGELHLGIGEEGIAAGVVSHLVPGDALALDHRSTPPLVARGVSLESLALEMLGSEDGLCRGRGGDMRLFSREHLAASSGIVGSSAPLACGFALAAQHLRPGRVSVAFFGEGAVNQGMLMESLNLAVVWKLPVLFVCKDDGISISTPSARVTGGSLLGRARGFGLPVARVDGGDAEEVWRAAGKAVARARSGGGPSFVLVRCYHPEGHFLGDPLLRQLDLPIGESRRALEPTLRAIGRSPGVPLPGRIIGLANVVYPLALGAPRRVFRPRDPFDVAARRLPTRGRVRPRRPGERRGRGGSGGGARPGGPARQEGGQR